MSKIAEVIVDIATSSTDKIFDYNLIDNVTVGSRVMVPFGNRKIEGYVINIKDFSNYPEDKIKNILYPIDDFVAINNEMLNLMWYMQRNYHIRLVDGLRLFIPAEMRAGKVKSKYKKIIYLNCDFETAITKIKKNATSQKDILIYLNNFGKAEYTQICNKFNNSAVNKLLDEKLIKCKSVENKRQPYTFIKDKKVESFTLKESQRSAVEKILSAKTFKTFLLHGVTGSGKTEVYIQCISECLKENKTSIMLVPEISLTPQMLERLRSRFEDKVAILHSGLSAGEKFDEWLRIKRGEAQVVIGARSAIFAPVENLGLIIIDEEHEQSYISENNPRYSAHDIAEFRAKYNDAILVKGSATPSIESYNKAKSGEYELLTMNERINKKPLPEIEIVNMCEEFIAGNKSAFSRSLLSAIDDCIKEGNQAMLFINRRGFSSFLMCRSCGFIAKCDDCDVSLVYHKEDNTLKCHYCGNRYTSFTKCPKCGSESIRLGSAGTEKIVNDLKELYPNIKVLRMDNDTTRTKESHFKILSDFKNKNAQILVGTQMIAKGHDFPDVTLVGIIDADLSLYQTDFRSNERTFQLITQVAGRAGRDKKPGKVILQTYAPRHYVYRFALNYDYLGFFAKELNIRQVTKFPPFTEIIRILIRDDDEQLVLNTTKEITLKLRQFMENDDIKDKFAYFQAMKSPVKKINGKIRYQILMRIKDHSLIEKIYEIIDSVNVKCELFVEINPQNLT